jgi:ABC-type phosphate transport system auxiliary subunit
MEWLFDRRSKSVGQSAARIVADMHRHLDKQSKKVKELEDTISKFQSLCTESLEDELIRLERRKKELLNELDETEAAILDRRTRLDVIKVEISNIINSNNDHNDHDNNDHTRDSITTPQKGYAQTMTEAKAR